MSAVSWNRVADCNLEPKFDITIRGRVQDWTSQSEIGAPLISDFLTSGGFQGVIPETGLALFHSTSCIMGAPRRHQYRRGYDASSIRMASPFTAMLARLWSAAIPCRQRATRRSRVGTLPRIHTVRDSKSAISVSAQVRKSELNGMLALNDLRLAPFTVCGYVCLWVCEVGTLPLHSGAHTHGAPILRRHSTIWA